MNKYGPYSKEVEEVISFVFEGHVLHAPFEPGRFDDYDTYIIHELTDMDRFEEPDEPDGEITGNYNWWDIFTSDDKMIGNARWEIKDQWHKEIAPVLQSVSREMSEHLNQQLRGQIPERDLDWIKVQLGLIMDTRAAIGTRDCIYNALFRVYRAYGYPCGWRGAFPSGQLVVYSNKPGRVALSNRDEGS